MGYLEEFLRKVIDSPGAYITVAVVINDDDTDIDLTTLLPEAGDIGTIFVFRGNYRVETIIRGDPPTDYGGEALVKPGDRVVYFAPGFTAGLIFPFWLRGIDETGEIVTYHFSASLVDDRFWGLERLAEQFAREPPSRSVSIASNLLPTRGASSVYQYSPEELGQLFSGIFRLEPEEVGRLDRSDPSWIDKVDEAFGRFYDLFGIRIGGLYDSPQVVSRVGSKPSPSRDFVEQALAEVDAMQKAARAATEALGLPEEAESRVLKTMFGGQKVEKPGSDSGDSS